MRTHNRCLKQEQIHVRITADVKSTLTKAAELSGMSMSAFVLNSAIKKARDVLLSNQQITLTNKEREKFLSLLKETPKVCSKLSEAIQRYQHDKESDR